MKESKVMADCAQQVGVQGTRTIVEMGASEAMGNSCAVRLQDQQSLWEM